MIYNADLEFIKKCGDDLKTFQDGDAVIEALVQQNMGGIKSGLVDMITVVGKEGGKKELLGWMHGGSSSDYAKKWYDLIAKNLEENDKAAKQKGILKKQLLSDIQLIRDAKEKLSEEQIEEMYKRGEQAANSLPGVGQGGEYKAQDWKKFGEDCARKLYERRERAKEQSKKIFGELLPTFVERSTKSFAALTDDPSKLANWEEEVKEAFKSIDDILDRGNAAIAELFDGDYKSSVLQTYDYFRNMIKSGFALWFSSTKAAEDELK